MQPFWGELYAAGVDVIVNGDAHIYERFARQNPQGQLDPTFGIRQFTVGTGGAPLGGLRLVNGVPTPIANSEVQITNSFGVLRLDLHEGWYEWQFLPVPAGTAPRDSGSESCHGSP